MVEFFFVIFVFKVDFILFGFYFEVGIDWFIVVDVVVIWVGKNVVDMFW